jgi:hypothetical protein
MVKWSNNASSKRERESREGRGERMGEDEWVESLSGVFGHMQTPLTDIEYWGQRYV